MGYIKRDTKKVNKVEGDAKKWERWVRSHKIPGLLWDRAPLRKILGFK